MSRLYLVQMHGVPGSGKSTLARAIGRELPAVVIDKDIVSSALLKTGMAPGSSGPPAWEVIWDLARDLLGQGFSVVADGPCGWPITELKGKGVAAATGASYRMVECVCSDEDLLAHRLKTRAALPTQPRAILDWASRPGSAEPSSSRVVIECIGPIEPLVADAVAHIRGEPVHGSARWHRGGGDWTGRGEKAAASRGIWSGHP
jgi:predicted kinase